MAGHSKWKNIRIRKGKQDAERSKIFTKLSREIIVAARMGGGDPDANPRLRLAISKARENSMPADNIKRSIQRGTGEVEGASYEQVTYEGYGPGGSAVILECYTENRNRTVSDVRHAFSKFGGNLAENGSVSWQFKYVGQITVPLEGVDPDELSLTAIDAGAQDVQVQEAEIVIETASDQLHQTLTAIEAAGYKVSEASLTYVPTNLVSPSEKDIPNLLRLLETLDDLDDVQATYVNVEITEAMLQQA
jgi:YebC/PmpR family DNA-binding regulatory protein